jgi:hypothetical protein
MENQYQYQDQGVNWDPNLLGLYLDRFWTYLEKIID